MAKNKDGASKDEVDTELTSELYYGVMGDAEAVEAKVVDFIDNYSND